MSHAEQDLCSWSWLNTIYTPAELANQIRYIHCDVNHSAATIKPPEECAVSDTTCDRVSTVFRLSVWGVDGVHDVIGADSPVVCLQVFFVQSHHASFLYPGHRHRQHVRRVSSLKKHADMKFNCDISWFCVPALVLVLITAVFFCSTFALVLMTNIQFFFSILSYYTKPVKKNPLNPL